MSARSDHVQRLLSLLPSEVSDLHGRAAIGWAERDPQMTANIDASAASLLIAVVSYEYGGASWDHAVRPACHSVHETWANGAAAYARRGENITRATP